MPDKCEYCRAELKSYDKGFGYCASADNTKFRAWHCYERELAQLREGIRARDDEFGCYKEDYFDAEAELAKWREFGRKVEDWSRAYPLEVFPEPDMKEVRRLLEAGGITIDCVSASNMRHVVTRLMEKITDKRLTLDELEEDERSTELDEMFEDPLDQLRGLSIDKPEPENKK